MANVIQLLRSATAGNVPASLAAGEIAINEADGIIFHRDSAGAVRKYYLNRRVTPKARGNSSTTTQTFSALDPEIETLTVTGAHSWAFSNLPASDYWEKEVVVTNGGAFTITFPTVNWVKNDGTSSTTFADMGVTLKSSGANTIIFWGVGNGTPFGKAG